MAGSIISKLPPFNPWKDVFATFLKHKSQESSVVGLTGSLDVEDKSREKCTYEKGIVGSSSANMVQKNISPKIRSLSHRRTK
jgi:hypothetical protein